MGKIEHLDLTSEPIQAELIHLTRQASWKIHSRPLSQLSAITLHAKAFRGQAPLPNLFT